MSGRSSREKGKRVERKFVHFLRSEGFIADRGQQFRGGPFSPDVNWDGPVPIHWEVKGSSRPRHHAALLQAEKDCRDGHIPVAACKKDGEAWTLTFFATDFLRILRGEFEETEASEEENPPPD